MTKDDTTSAAAQVATKVVNGILTLALLCLVGWVLTNSGVFKKDKSPVVPDRSTDAIVSAAALDVAIARANEAVEIEKRRLGNSVVIVDGADTALAQSIHIELKLQYLLTRLELVIKLQKIEIGGRPGRIVIPGSPTGQPGAGAAPAGSINPDN